MIFVSGLTDLMRSISAVYSVLNESSSIIETPFTPMVRTTYSGFARPIASVMGISSPVGG